MNRRQFLKTTTASSSLLLAQTASSTGQTGNQIDPEVVQRAAGPTLPDLSPARWIWYPSARTLPNTFILFRRALHLSSKPRRANGWIAADSRYKLEVNDRRVQWGPAPCDPRWADADPIDLTEFLVAGDNALCATVLYYGEGDGACPLGKPGFLFRLELEYPDGHVETVVSDAGWRTLLCRAWTPGHPKRWYVRALQEEFDARRFPHGWTSPAFTTDSSWLPAMLLNGSHNRPALSTNYFQFMLDLGPGPVDTRLRPRSIPFLNETFVPIPKLAQTFWFTWHTTPQDYFDCHIPDAFTAVPAQLAIETSPGNWNIELDGSRAAALTFELTEQVVGWPSFSIDAPAGTTIELLVHEAHALDGPPLLNTHFDSWTRFICKEGENDFETFDFESLRWLQLHIHNANGPVTISGLRVRRRIFPWPNQPHLTTSEPALQRLFDASFNTLDNCAQETLVDGMARERQQYSGDCGHQIHALHLAMGEPLLSARYLTTWSQGMTKDGFFLDCWPAYDRLARLMERQLDLTDWGPLLDHGVGFTFDCWHHYTYTANLAALHEPYPRLLRLAQYFQGKLDANGLVPVENLGVPSVWIDHHAYLKQRHKQCAFNLYIAASMEHALAPICRAFGDDRQAAAATQFGRELVKATVRRYWSAERQTFINNLPWLHEEPGPRTCDRSLATALLYDECPGNQTAAALRSLVENPPEMGFSYPANACWRMWALARYGRVDAVLKEWRERWATMDSVIQNNTLAEDWNARPDSSDEWSHCPLAPIYISFQGLMGLKPLTPGFASYELRPQFGDLEDLALTAQTVRGRLSLRMEGKQGARRMVLELPHGGGGELVLPSGEAVDLPQAAATAPPGHRRYQLPSGGDLTLMLKHT